MSRPQSGNNIGAWDPHTPPRSAQDGAQSPESPDYWSQHEELPTEDLPHDDLTTSEQNTLIQTYTPAPVAANGGKNVLATLGAATTLPPVSSEPSIVISSLATGAAKPGVHFTEHDKRRKEYLMRRLKRQLRGPTGPAGPGAPHEAPVMEVAHGPGTVIAKGVPDLRVPFGYYYDRDGRGHKGIEPPSPVRPPREAPPLTFGTTITAMQSQSLASFMLTTQASVAPESLEVARKQRHKFSVSPCLSISMNLSEGYGPSPSALQCDSALRSSDSTLSLRSRVLKPKLRIRKPAPPRVTLSHKAALGAY